MIYFIANSVLSDIMIQLCVEEKKNRQELARVCEHGAKPSYNFYIP